MVRICGFHPHDPGSSPGWGSWSRLAQLVERKTLNLVVEGSSPSVGVPFCFYFISNFIFVRVLELVRMIARTRRRQAPVAQLAARRSHNPKVASSILAGSSAFSPLV